MLPRKGICTPEALFGTKNHEIMNTHTHTHACTYVHTYIYITYIIYIWFTYIVINIYEITYKSWYIYTHIYNFVIFKYQDFCCIFLNFHKITGWIFTTAKLSSRLVFVFRYYHIMLKHGRFKFHWIITHKDLTSVNNPHDSS